MVPVLRSVADGGGLIETPRAKAAWADYVAMGPGRSLESLVRRYQSASGSVPTKRLMTLCEWSRTFGWQSRLGTIADAASKEIEAAEQERRRTAMEMGTALDYERVLKLRHIVEVLAEEFDEIDKRWLPDVKSIGSGEFAERVDIVRFNAALIEQYRGALDDLAKETGGRKQRTELTLVTPDEIKRVAEERGVDPAEVAQLAAELAGRQN